MPTTPAVGRRLAAPSHRTPLNLADILVGFEHTPLLLQILLIGLAEFLAEQAPEREIPVSREFRIARDIRLPVFRLAAETQDRPAYCTLFCELCLQHVRIK